MAQYDVPPTINAREPPSVVNDYTIARDASNGILFADTTVALGSQAVVLSHTISVDASSMVVDGRTYPLLPSLHSHLKKHYDITCIAAGWRTE